MEILVSAFVISASFIALMAIIVSGMRVSMASRDEVIASQLAQEGAELVRNIRDNNWVNRQPIFQGINVSSPNFICVDVTADTLGDPVFAACDLNGSKIYYDSANKRYVHGSGEATKFRRRVVISSSSPATYREIRSQAVWGRDDFPADCDTSNKCSETVSILTLWFN